MKKLIPVLILSLFFFSCSRSKNLELESRLLYDKNEYKKALLVLEKHLEKDSKDTSAYYLGFLINKKLNYHLEALNYLNKSIEIDSSNPLYYIDRIELNKELRGKDKFILEDIDKLIEIDPQNTANYLQEKGDIYFQKKDYKEAIKIYQEGLLEDRKDIYLMYNIAASYINLENYSEAIEYGKKITEQEEGKGDGYFIKGIAWKNLNREYKACVNFKKAIDLEFDLANNYYKGYCSPPENSVGFGTTLFLSDFSCKISKWEIREESSDGNYNFLDIYLIFHNRSYERKRVDLGEFKVSDSNGVLYSREFFDTKEDNLSEVNLLPDGVIKGWVSYKIPKDSSVNLKYIPFTMDNEIIYTMYLSKIFFSENM